MIDRDKLRKLCQEATPGPWRTFKTRLGRENGIESANPSVPSDEAVMEDEFSDENDAKFIAATDPGTILALLDELDSASCTLSGW